ncbi:sigma-70 family RNA polymerase sigma factor [Synechococcus sp. H55.11]|uniref:sigma-70 family RNA polymerase sigma factor n=1 Tax=Synechococcus sp. H55.11 TaxID=2967121 RepID=UPI0039C06083
MAEQPRTPSPWRERVRDWPSRSDVELMEALTAGHSVALAVLYDRYAGLICGLALKILGHAAEAEDLTQAVFVELWHKPDYDPRQGSVSSFLCALTRSRAIERLRSQDSHQRFLKHWQPLLAADGSAPIPFEQLSLEERRQAVQEALSQLPESQRQVLELLYYQGLSQADIAQHWGIPLEAVKARTRQALCKLRESLSLELSSGSEAASPPSSEAQEELAGYLLGDLSPEQASALEARLTQDPRLLAELQALQETLHLLPYGLPGVIPPASLRGKVMAEAGIEEALTPLQPALSSLGFGRLTAEWRWVGGLAAGALALLVFDNWRLRQALQLARLESVRTLSHLLQQPGSRLVNLQGEVGSANLLLRPGEWQEVVLAARDLPQPAPGERYHLWLKLDDGEILHCGTFQVDAQGSALVALRPPHPLPEGARPQEVLVTAQAAAVPRQPQGEVLLKAKVSWEK